MCLLCEQGVQSLLCKELYMKHKVSVIGLIHVGRLAASSVVAASVISV